MNEPHPITGLTPKDVKDIRKCWSVIERNLEETGTRLFLNFFTKFPQHLKYFPHFQKIPTNELPRHEPFRAHGLRVMKAIGGTVKFLDNPQVILDHYHNLGVVHRPFNITTAAWRDMQGTLEELIRKTCKLDARRFTPWEKLIALAFRIMLNAA